MPARDGSPVVDIAAAVAGPALVMGMVGSLVWFLVDVLYAGAYPDRLLWCLSFFVFGAVLIARLTIEEGSSRAAIYSVALGGATLLAMIRFVEYRNARVEAVGWAVSLGLMGLTWWLANRLTWDSTHFDEDRRASGRGLLAAGGLTASERSDEDVGEDPEDAAKPQRKDPPGLLGWLERLNRYRAARRKRPHTPGAWVLGFGLAALPVFALGQSLVPADDLARRRTTLLEAAVFVGSGLGLLVTTSLMGLRRYLEQRNAPVPAALTFGWLGLGGALVVAFLVVAMLLPRPHSETPWFTFDRDSGKADVNASRWAQLRDRSAGKGEGTEGKRPEDDEKGKPTDGPNGKAGGGEKRPSGGEKPDKSDGSGKSDGSSKDGAKAEPSKSPEKSGEKRNPFTGEPMKKDEPSQKDEGSQQPDGSSPAKQLTQALGAVASLVKWLVFALLAVGVIAAFVYFALKGLAPFTDWAKNLLAWLRGLFAPRFAAPPDGDADADSPEESAPPPTTFADFPNPFADGTARRRTPADLAAYTFAALDAWAWDRGHGRTSDETPGEFAARLGEAFPEVAESARIAADLAVRGMYARVPLSADAVRSLAGVWKALDRTSAAAARE